MQQELRQNSDVMPLQTELRPCHSGCTSAQPRARPPRWRKNRGGAKVPGPNPSDRQHVDLAMDESDDADGGLVFGCASDDDWMEEENSRLLAENKRLQDLVTQLQQRHQHLHNLGT